MGTFGSVGKKSRNRFKKQRNEYSLLIPSGDREQRRTVRVIFYLRYKRGWRGVRIADYLNRNHIPSPRGKEWSQRQVQIIYENEAYTGVTFNDQTYSGRFFRRDQVLGFVALDRDKCDLAVKKTFTLTLRPMEEWDRIDQPHMYDFLPRDVRDLAIAAQAKMWKERTDPTRQPRRSNAHPASEYLLSGRLHAMQDHEVLRGSLSGPPGKKTPYYRHPKSKRGRRKGSIYNNLIRADVLHDAIVALLAGVLSDAPELRQRLEQHLQELRTSASRDEPDVAQLEAERAELKQQIAVTVRSLKGAALADAQEELRHLGDRRNVIEERLAIIRRNSPQETRSPEAVINEAMRILAEDRRRLLTLPIEPLRDLVNRLVLDATVDMETKAVELKLALPTWALISKTKEERQGGENKGLSDTYGVCPAASSRSQAGGWTHPVLGVFGCKYEWVRGSHLVAPCYQCRRTEAA